MSGFLRIRHRIGEIEAFFNQTLLPPATDLSLRARHPKVLSKYRNTSFPQWEVYLRGSHSARKIFHWLTSKRILGLSLSRSEELIYYVAIGSNQEADFYLLLKELEKRSYPGRPILPQIDKNLPLLIETSRILHGYQPSVIYLKEWNPVRITPLRRIGVGYKDKGHLGTEPSWKDQIVDEEEETDRGLDDFLKRCLTLMRNLDQKPSEVSDRPTSLTRQGKSRKG